MWPRVQQSRQLGPQQRSTLGTGVDKVRSLETALVALGAEDVAAKTEVEVALERAKAEKKVVQSNHQARWSPDAVLEHAPNKESFRGGTGDGRYGGSRGRILAGCFEESSTGSPGAPMASQLSECRSFIERSERCLEKIDAERAAELVQVNEARSRLTRLEAQAAVLPPDIPRQSTADVSMELEEIEGEACLHRAGARRGIVCTSLQAASHVTQCGVLRSCRFVSLDGQPFWFKPLFELGVTQ